MTGILIKGDLLPEDLLARLGIGSFRKFIPPDLHDLGWQGIGQAECDGLDRLAGIQMREVTARMPAFVSSFRHG